MSRGYRTSVRDMLEQARRAVVGRPARTLLAATGIAVGVGAAVATLGITASAGAAISDRFDAAGATLVTLRYPVDRGAPELSASARVRSQVNGVVDAGLLCRSRERVPAQRLPPPLGLPGTRRLGIVAAEPAALSVLGVDARQGRAFDAGHHARADRVVLLDEVAARDLGVTRFDANPVIYIGEVSHTVLGVFTAPDGDGWLSGAAVVPYRMCLDTPTAYQPPELLIRTALGAADQVGREAPIAALPEAVSAPQVLVPPDPRSFRNGVPTQARARFLGLAAACLFVGMIVLSNTALMSMMERRREIALRRAIGASRRAVAGQFLAESAFLGLAGGALGTLFGINAVALTCLWRAWIPTFDPRLIAVGPLLGLVVGLFAGAFPAYAAARVEPDLCGEAGPDLRDT